MNLRRFISVILYPNGKVHFLTLLRDCVSILDVGCGNNSPYLIKSILPRSIYTGIDVGNYNQTRPNPADHYIITAPESFAEKIAEFNACFDAVISSHNLEHCNDRLETFIAMLEAVRPDGLLYISFPSEKSVTFPSRVGTLNYFDDSTHKDNPPNIDQLMEIAREKGFEVIFMTRCNRPLLSWVLGLLFEPISILKGRVMRGTWEFYGFEAIMILRRVRR
jgi:SAM-dependent methyltransferase